MDERKFVKLCLEIKRTNPRSAAGFDLRMKWRHARDSFLARFDDLNEGQERLTELLIELDMMQEVP